MPRMEYSFLVGVCSSDRPSSLSIHLVMLCKIQVQLDQRPKEIPLHHFCEAAAPVPNDGRRIEGSVYSISGRIVELWLAGWLE